MEDEEERKVSQWTDKQQISQQTLHALRKRFKDRLAMIDQSESDNKEPSNTRKAITFSNFCYLSRQQGAELTKEHAATLFERWDSDRDGVVGWYDFVVLNTFPPAQVLPFLYLGAYDTACNKSLLQKLHIEYILNVTAECENVFENDFIYHRIELDDRPTECISAVFDEAFGFIDKAEKAGANVYVHCQQGISRSAAIVMAYLMKRNLWNLDAASEYVCNCRPIIAPNCGFMKQLKQFEQKLSLGHRGATYLL